MSIRIDWNKLNRLPDAADQSFEKFCFHIAAQKFGPFGTIEYFYNTPGSEFYIELNKKMEYAGVTYDIGDVIGLQAKYWIGAKTPENSPLGKDHIDELAAGFSTTLKRKPNTKLWIICTPGGVVEDQWIKLTTKLVNIEGNCQFESWHKDFFESFYASDINKYNGVFNYFFSEQYIGIESLHSITKDTLSNQKKKYDVELHLPSDFENRLISIVDTRKAENLLQRKIQQIAEHVNNDRKKAIFNGHWGEEYLSEEVKVLLENDFSDKYILSDQLKATVSDAKSLSEMTAAIIPLLESYKEKHKSKIEPINKGLKEAINKRQDHYSFSNYLNEVIKRGENIERLIRTPRKGEDSSLEQLLWFITNNDYSVFAEAGYGKTHFACSLAQIMIEQNLPVLLVTGGLFRHCASPEQKIKEILGLSQEKTFEDALDILDFMAQQYGCRLPIIIDGLNESTPTVQVWQYHLLPLRRKVMQRKNLIIVTTCREKPEYLQIIYGADNYKDVANHVRLHGFAENNLEQATMRYFEKYNIRPNNKTTHVNFENPLLLKIFCIVNEGRKDFDLNEYTLASCMEEYNKRLIYSLSLVNGAENRIAKIRIKKGLNDVALQIWNNNDREFDYEKVFYKAFGDSAEELLDEGLCFVTDRDADGEKVKFTYDMVAGYNIAKALLDKAGTDTDITKFIQFFQSQDVYLKLFATDPTRHTLSEDICKSLFYLIPKYYGKEWFSLMPDVNVFSSALNNIDIILASPEGRDALMTMLQQHCDNLSFKEKFCDCLFSRVINRYNLTDLAFFAPYIISFTSIEWDTYWNQRFAHYDILNRTYGLLHDKFFANRFKIEDNTVLALMMSGITDIEFRQKFIKSLFELVNENQQLLSSIMANWIFVKDPFIFESVISVITGIGLRTNNPRIIDSCIKILEVYVKEYTSNHIVLLDNLETLYSYNEYLTGRKHNRMFLYKNYDEEWQETDTTGFPLYQAYDYDYEKLRVRPLSNMHYRNRGPFNTDQIHRMLYHRILSMGADITLYNKMQQEENNKAKYRKEQKCSYLHKYGRHAIMELTGWMMLHNYIDNEYKTTFRHSIIDIDPTFPKKQLRTLITCTYMPKTINDLPTWIKENHLSDMQSWFMRSLPKQKGEWILMCGFVSQKMDRRFADFYMSGTVEMIPEAMNEEKFIKEQIADSVNHNHIMAGEIGWRELEFTEYEMEDEMLPLLYRYSFNEWSKSRFVSHPFYFLNPTIAQSLKLYFNVDTMTYYNVSNEKVSAYYHNGKDQFFYLRRDTVNSILKQYKAKLRFHTYQRQLTTHNLPSTAPAMSTTYQEFEDNVFYRFEEKK